MNRDQIIKTIEDHRETLKGFTVRKLGLFGSSARGESSAASDLDFLVEFDQKSFDNFVGLKIFLEELFNCPVNLVLDNALKPRLRSRILEETIYAPGL